MQTLSTRIDALLLAGFRTEGDGVAKYRAWRHFEYSYVTVDCSAGVWTMRSPDQSIEVKNDLDIPAALDLLTGG